MHMKPRTYSASSALVRLVSLIPLVLLLVFLGRPYTLQLELTITDSPANFKYMMQSQIIATYKSSRGSLRSND